VQRENQSALNQGVRKEIQTKPKGSGRGCARGEEREAAPKEYWPNSGGGGSLRGTDGALAATVKDERNIRKGQF